MAKRPPVLLAGPYRPPPVKRGDRETCLYRDCDVVITSWTDARIPWPRYRALDGPGGGSGLLITDEMVRAIRTESAAAMMYWFGVGSGAVWRWRKAFGVASKFGTPGSSRLHDAASEQGARKMRGRKLSPAVVRRMRAARKTPQRRPAVWVAKDWKARELTMLGTMSDEQLAKMLGRPVNGVRLKRTRLGIPSFHDHRRKE